MQDSAHFPTESAIAPALIDWYQRAGRHDLPWSVERTPYRVWVAEIMLQQTQVATVIPYYQRFMTRFPGVVALADAPLDEVLHLWSGLGYYARARNLHRAAQHIRDKFAGEFPALFAELAALPGVGRSTAGAILALSRAERFPILDGNVRRVLARYFAVATPAHERTTLTRLWQLAHACTPYAQIAEYTQAIMDLGATVCVRGMPRCPECPLAAACVARSSGRQRQLPARAVRRARPQRQAYMVLARRTDGSVWLERRPEHGVWGGLWCPPEFASDQAAGRHILERVAGVLAGPAALPAVEHAFTHFDLRITPLLVRCAGADGAVQEGATLWYNLSSPATVGLPAPIRRLLAQLPDEP